MPENQKPKNIVICCDGTGNQFGKNSSNVVKLYTALTINNQQTGYYHPGVGTMGAPTARNRVEETWSVLKGLAFAAGFMANVEDAYRYLMETYSDGDQIYLFGFSRGSYTVRALAAILHAFGLLCRGNEGHIPYIIRLFTDEMALARANSRRQRKENKSEKTTSLDVHEAFKETFSHDVTLRFVGLWDTVSSVGWITQPMRLLYSAQNPIIQTGRHAVSIDERRCYYQDNLWGDALPTERTPSLRHQVSQPDGTVKQDLIQQDILQVWFAGVHSDIGGSYAQRESALSNITLRWLLDEARANGLLVQEDRVKLIFGERTDDEYAAASFYQPPVQPGSPHESLKGPWWLLEILPHRHYVIDADEVHWRTPFGSRRRVPAGSVIHGSVRERLSNPELHYAPNNLCPKYLQPHPDPQPGSAVHREGFHLYQPPPPASHPKAQRTASQSAWILGAIALALTAAAVVRSRRC
jgi:uncharacterized protein (DUF2235 family)